MTKAVFISHAREDADAAREVCEALEREGIACWIAPRDIPAGLDWDEEILRGIEDSSVVIVILTRNTELAKRVPDEVSFARDEEKRVFGFRVEDVQPPRALRFHIQRSQWLNGYPPPVEEHLAPLVESVRHLLDGAPSHIVRETERRAVIALPARNRNFVGRDELMTTLEAALAGDQATVAVTGPPGFGKTQLALEYAHRHADGYDVVCAITAEGPEAARASMARLTEPLGLPPGESEAQALATVRAHFERADRWLLLFDNVEEVQDIVDLVPRGRGHVVITSRQRAWREVASEVISVDALSTDEAARFLLRRTGRDDEEGATELASKLGGNALVLEQAAAYLESTDTPFEEYQRLLEDDFGSAIQGTVAGSDARSALSTWNLALAKAAERSPGASDLLSLSAYLAPDDIPIRALGLPLASVNALVRYSLVSRTGEDTFSVHRTVQAIARARLGPEDRRSWADEAVRSTLSAFPADPADVVNRTLCARLLPHAEAALGAADEFGADPVARAHLLDRVGVFLRSRALYIDARRSFERALGVLSAVARSDDAMAGTVRNHLGALLRDLGDFAGAVDLHKVALAHHGSAAEVAPADLADVHTELGRTLVELGDLSGAREQFELALAIDTSAFGSDHRAVGEDLIDLANLLARSGNISLALENYRRALTLAEARGEGEHPEAQSVRYVVESVASAGSEQESDTGRRKLEALVRSYEEAYGLDHPEVAELRQLLADDLLKIGDLDESVVNYRRVLEIDENAFGQTHWKVARDLLRLSVVLTAQEDSTGALDCLRRALSIFEQVAIDSYRRVPSSLVHFDDALDRLAALPAATEEFGRIVSLCSEALGEDALLTAAALDHLGEELDEAGQGERASEVLGRAQKLFVRHLGPDHIRVAACLRRRGVALGHQGELDLAAQALLLACELDERAAPTNDIGLLSDLMALLPVQLQLDRQAALTAEAVAGAATIDPASETDNPPLGAPRPDVIPEAPAVLRRIRQVAERTVGVEPVRGLAEALQRSGLLAEALELFEQVRETRERTFGPQHPEVAAAHNDVGRVLLEKGDLSGARLAFERAAEIHAKEYGPDHEQVATDLIVRIAPVLASVGETEAAIDALERGMEICERIYAADRRRIEELQTSAWTELGRLALRHGRPADARQLLERGLSHSRQLEHAAEYYAKLGALAALDRDRGVALDHLRQSTTLLNQIGVPVPFWTVVRLAAFPRPNWADRHLLDDVLSDLREELLVSEQGTFRPTMSSLLPSGWFAKESMTLLAPDGQANVIASSEPLDPSIDTEAYATVQGDLLRKEFPEYEEYAFDEVELFGGRRGYRRHFQWRPPDGVPVTQIQLYYAESGRGFTATATTPSANFVNVENELRQILAGLLI